MQKFQIILILIAVFLLTATTLTAQNYHEEDKEDLRAFMRQGTNYEKLGLTIDDTLSWYDYEEWIPATNRVSWIEINSLKRIDSINFIYSGLYGKLKISSPYLLRLDCSMNGLTELDVSENINLHTLNCSENGLTELDISSCIALTILDCGKNKLTKLDVSENINLRELYCLYNELIELDLSRNINLDWLLCSSNGLTKLDVSENTKLKGLHCSINELTELDLSENINLRELSCSRNKLKFSTLPIVTFYEYLYSYVYNAQDTIYGGIKAHIDTIDLRSEYEINGNITTFNWFDISDDYYEKEIELPTNENGVFSLTEEHINKKLRCKMKNAQFPYLLLVYETDIVNSIIDHSIATYFTISPNPISATNSHDAIASFGLLESGDITIEVCDMLGECFYSTTNFYDIGEYAVTLGIKGIPSGSYICRLLSKGKQIGTEGFVVER